MGSGRGGRGANGGGGRRRGARYPLPLAQFAIELHLASGPVQRVRQEVVQSLDAHHDRSQCHGDLRVAHIADVGNALDYQVMNLGMEGAFSQARSTAESDRHKVGSDLSDGESLRGEPSGDGGNVGFRWSETLADLRRSEPLVIVRRTAIVLGVDVLVEGCLPFRTPAQHQGHVGQGQTVADRAMIVLCYGKGAGVAMKRNQLVVVDGLSDASRRGGRDG